MKKNTPPTFVTGHTYIINDLLFIFGVLKQVAGLAVECFADGFQC